MEEFIPGVMILTRDDVTAGGEEKAHVVPPLWEFIPQERRLLGFMIWQATFWNGVQIGMMRITILKSC